MTHTGSTQYIYKVMAWVCIAFALVGCSTTKHLPEGEQLYVGISKTKIIHEDASNEGQRALAAAENVINVPPNNALFGSARYRLGIPFGLWVYNRYVNDSSKVGKWIFNVFASEPVLISTVNPDLRSKVAVNVLKENGYFNATVTNFVETLKKNPRKARVHYTIDMQEPYIYDSIQYLPPIRLKDSTYLYHSKISVLHKGEQFNLSKQIEDRDNITALLRDAGFYYFKANTIIYEADTVMVPQKVQLRSKFKTGIPAEAFTPWTIDKIVFTINGSRNMYMPDSLAYDGISIRYNSKKPAVRPSVLAQRVALKPGTLYSQTLEQQTRIALSRLGAFVYTDLNFVPSDSLHHKFTLYINSILDKPWDTSIETSFKVKSNNFLGPGARFTVGRRNAFGGGENLSAALYGNYEWQQGSNAFGVASPFNSYELGMDVSLNAPSILVPFLHGDPFNFPTNTDITLRGSMLNRAMYFRMFSAAGVLSYVFNRWNVHRHTFVPFKLQFNFLDRRTQKFDEIIGENPALGLSLRSQLIPQMGYTYTYDNTFKSRGNHHIWMEVGLYEAGNLINALYAIKKPYFETKKILGVPFAQFVKTTADLHYTYAINRKQTIAARLATGIIYSYGNMQVAPYNEQFYVGGANSIRAFTVRSIGPGRYIPAKDKYAFIDQTGDFKLEANLEWRMQIVGKLYGALFLDAGNVWLLKAEESRPGGSLQEIKSVQDFFQQVALGTGLGLRYDLGFFVIRLDFGVGLHLPYETNKIGYYNIPHFKDAFGFHLAVGYPF